MMNDFQVSPELVARYILNRKKDLEIIKQAVAEKDYAQVVTKAHNLKGNAESFGFPELGVIGKEMEIAALAKDEAAVAGYIAKIEAWLRNYF